jgi:hypothetical protein
MCRGWAVSPMKCEDPHLVDDVLRACRRAAWRACRGIGGIHGLVMRVLKLD